MITAQESAMRHIGIGYRTVLEVRGYDPIEVIERNVRKWINGKFRLTGADSWNARERFAPRHGFTVEVVDLPATPSDDMHRRLYRVTDSNPSGTFVVLIAATREYVGGGHLVISAGLKGATEATAIDDVSVPGIVPRILQDVSIRDGLERLTSAPTTVTVNDLNRVPAAILDQTRAGMVVVAVSIAPAFDDIWAKIARSLIRESIGISNLFVVPSDLSAELNKHLPPWLHVRPGQVRTFAPHASVDDSEDGLRHRFLSAGTLSRSTRNHNVGTVLAHVHARAPRALFLARSLPPKVRETLTILDRAELTQQRNQLVGSRLEEHRRAAMRRVAEASQSHDTLPVHESLTSESGAPTPQQPAEQAATRETDSGQQTVGAVVPPRGTSLWKKLVEFATGWLGRKPSDERMLEELDEFIQSRKLEVQAAEEQLDDAIAEHESTRRTLEEIQDRSISAELTALEAQEELSSLRDMVSWQWRELSKLKSTGLYEPDADWTAAPVNVLDLVESLHEGNANRHPAFERVQFTIDSEDSAVSELAKYDNAGVYARAFWDYVRVLYDYAGLKNAGAFSGNVHMYLNSPEVGFKVTPKQHAARESDSVMNNKAWADERVRPVPARVSEDCRAMMDAHFKPSHHDTFAPRMHYYDDTAPGGTGKIYIGYIGRHLTNTQT